MVKDKSATMRRFENAAAQRKQEQYVLHLYISGMTPRSMRAIENLQVVCDQYLRGRYRLKIDDIYLHPELMQREQIIAAPTLIKKSPHPTRRLVGDLSNLDRVLLGLGLKPQNT